MTVGLWNRRVLTAFGHIDRMHEAPSDHRRWCHQNDDARPLVARSIDATILAASCGPPVQVGKGQSTSHNHPSHGVFRSSVSVS